MNRFCTLLLAVLIVAAPLSVEAQDRGARGNRDRDRGGDRSEQVRPEPRRISVAEAQAIARSRAGGATYVGYAGTRGDQYVFRFDRGGQLFDVAVSMTGR